MKNLGARSFFILLAFRSWAYQFLLPKPRRIEYHFALRKRRFSLREEPSRVQARAKKPNSLSKGEGLSAGISSFSSRSPRGILLHSFVKNRAEKPGGRILPFIG
jgi:hypothetical protein